MKRIEQQPPPQPFQVPVNGVDGHSADLEEEVRRRAYQIYEERGMTPGSDVEDWLQAEAEARVKQRPKKAA